MIRCLGVCAVLAMSTPPAAAEVVAWRETTWQGEPALVSASGGWQAIVSLARGRLMSFGPAGGELNLLFAPATQGDPAGWGGHRVWLGPQSTWPAIWPPPAAWEHSAAESHTISDGTLRLVMPAAGNGWPRLTRTYGWEGARLVCSVELSGGTRTAQIIQIIQVPQKNVVTAAVRPGAGTPHGYVLLPAGTVSRLTADFSPPPHVTLDADQVTLRHLGVIQKLGFPPQALAASDHGRTLRVARGPQAGAAGGEPDQGFNTQVYLGGAEPFIELEQLTPLWSPGAPARATLVLEGAVP
jgi:hypothetical protein